MTAGEVDYDMQLVEQLKAGDPDAAARLVDQYADDVYHFVYNQVGGSAQDAEDIVQETFVAALKAIRRFRGDSKLRTWLFGIASHKVIDMRRWAARRPQVNFGDIPFFLDAPGMVPERVLERDELRKAVRLALLQLLPHYRAALVLKYVEGMSVREIAGVMHKTEKSIESILVRARRALASMLEDK